MLCNPNGFIKFVFADGCTWESEVPALAVLEVTRPAAAEKPTVNRKRPTAVETPAVNSKKPGA
eukprot:3591159-Lingulodinium_polyedra.AAC.1